MIKWLEVGLLCFLTLLSCTTAVAREGTRPSVAFYYGNEAPVELLDQFDWIVVEAANLQVGQRQALERQGGQAFAYVSVGELDPWRPYPEGLPQSVLVADNPDWNSRVADLTRPEWQHYLIEQRISPLWEAGYRALFLDTLDSYQRFAPDGEAAAAQQHALVALIGDIQQRFPGIKLLLNRGFEVLDQVHGQIVGVAAESLHHGWHPASGIFGPVNAADRQWLGDQLARARDQYNLPTIAIDYVPAADRELARDIARRIADDGFIPWVSVPMLDQVGVGLIEPVPRRVLVLYDKSNTEAGELAYDNAHRYLAMPLEYLGYGAEYLDANGPLPSDVLHGRYAGVISWFSAPLANAPAYSDWLLGQLEDGLKAVILGDPGVTLAGPLGEFMGLRSVSLPDQRDLTIVAHDDLLGFEGMPERPSFFESGYTPTRAGLTTHLTLRDPKGTELYPVITGPWGGVATAPWILQQATEFQLRWILDPFAFLERSLDLPVVPVPDPTTENGARYWITQIDGDAFVSQGDFPGAPYTGEVMLDEILSRYRVPTTVSIIEGEIGPTGLYPHLRSRLEPLARRIFSLPWVEVATHTYSHPFEWENLTEGDLAGQGQTRAGFNYNMPLPNYRFSLEREIAGSTDYINRHLAPSGKPVKVVLWTGNALPPEEALAISERLGLRNLNGGNTSITQSFPSLTRVSPMLRPQGPYLQVYAPQINENVYTNHMLGPLWGYRRAVETYQLTDQPRRLKPIDIYYHFYSAAGPAALTALKQVYDYVLTQETLPLYTSTWSDIATQWYDLGVARRLDGGWQIRGATQTRTLRLPSELGWPDLARSKGVAGVRDIEAGRYVALDGQGDALLYLTSHTPTMPHLAMANGRITEWRAHTPGQFTMRLAAEAIPLKVELAAAADCRVDAPGARQERRGDTRVLLYFDSQSGRIEVSCGQ